MTNFEAVSGKEIHGLPAGGAPTEDKVAEMLKFTSHRPDEVLGRMNPGSEAGETWTYTVKDAAVNAVMAGAKPEYFPVILALGSTGMTAVNVSDNGFMSGAVINGKIRDEIGLNYEEGAVGPYAHANTTIGRAWGLRRSTAEIAKSRNHVHGHDRKSDESDRNYRCRK